jgi:PAS domain S-box-containing protein
MKFRSTPIILGIASMVILMLTAFVIVSNLMKKSEQQLYAELKEQVTFLSEAINPTTIKGFIGDASDLNNPAYLELKKMIEFSIQTNHNLRYIYIVGQNTKKELFFIMDTGQPNKRLEEAKPGQIYQNADDGFISAFKQGQVRTVGPYTDSWGTFITGIAPIIDPKTKRTLALACIDFDSKEWKNLINKDVRPIVFGIALLLSIVIVILVLLLIRLALNIEKHKETLIALERNKQYRKTIFESSKIPLVIMDAITFEFTDGNRAAINAFGFSGLEELKGKTPIDISAVNQYDGTPSSEKAIFFIDKAKHDGGVTFNWRHQRPDGTIWDAEVHLLKFELEGKEMLQFSLIDITDRIQNEELLQKLSMVVEQSPSSVIITNIRGEIDYVNQMFTQVTGYRHDEVLGKNPRFLKSGHQSHSISTKKCGPPLLQEMFGEGNCITKRRMAIIFGNGRASRPLKTKEGK